MKKMSFEEFEEVYVNLPFEKKVELWNKMKEENGDNAFYFCHLNYSFFNDYFYRKEDVAEAIAKGEIDWNHPYIVLDYDNKLLSLTKKDVEDIINEDWCDCIYSHENVWKDMFSKVIYYWTAESSDGAFEDESRKEFDTKEECYNDMRNAALEKMKWNTNYKEDLCDWGSDIESDEDYIGYDVRFSKNWITHKSYSGLYTYTIHVRLAY